MTSFAKLCDIVAQLRAPGGCPWDREQTHESLLPALIEEAYEVAEAARAKNDAHFCEELGDLLLLVVMHAEIAREAGRFNIEQVLREVSEKLVRRHPHVFGSSDARDAGSVLKPWEASKSGAESAWQKATDKFVERFNRLEDELRRQDKRLGDVDLEEMDAIWERIKNDEARMTNVEGMTK